MSEDSSFFLESSEGMAKKSKSNVVKKKQTVRNYYREYLMLLTASQFLTTIQKVALYTESLTEHQTADILELVELQQSSPEDFSREQKEKLAARLAEFRSKIEMTDEHVHPS